MISINIEGFLVLYMIMVATGCVYEILVSYKMDREWEEFQNRIRKGVGHTPYHYWTVGINYNEED